MGNKRTFALILVIGLAAAACKKGSEHPGEHPSEHPAENSSNQSRALPEISQEELVKGYSAAILRFIEEHPNLPVERLNGEAADISAPVGLERIHKHKIVRYEGSTYFACSDFKSQSEPGKSYDFDFFAERTPQGWRIDRVLLHKVDGRKLLVYKDNRPVPA